MQSQFVDHPVFTHVQLPHTVAAEEARPSQMLSHHQSDFFVCQVVQRSTCGILQSHACSVQHATHVLVNVRTRNGHDVRANQR